MTLTTEKPDDTRKREGLTVMTAELSPLITNVTTEEVWRIIVRGTVQNAPPMEPRHGRQRRVSFTPNRVSTIYEPNGLDGWRIARTIVEGPRLIGERRVEDYFDSTEIGLADAWVREFTVTNRPQRGGGRRATPS